MAPLILYKQACFRLYTSCIWTYDGIWRWNNFDVNAVWLQTKVHHQTPPNNSTVMTPVLSRGVCLRPIISCLMRGKGLASNEMQDQKRKEKNVYLYICVYMYHNHRIGSIRRRSTCSKQIHHICILGAHGTQWPLNFIAGILKNLDCPNLLTGGVFETNHLEARLKLGDFGGKAPAVSRTNPASSPSPTIGFRGRLRLILQI